MTYDIRAELRRQIELEDEQRALGASRYLTTRVMVNLCMSQSLLQTAATKVTEALIENLEFKGFREMNRKGYKGFMKAQDARGSFTRQRKSAVKKLFTSEGCAVNVSPEEKVSIGTKCMELVIDATGFFDLEKVRRANGFAYSLRPTETLQDWFDKQHARCSLLDPINMPMVVRPRRWRSPTYGG